MQKTMLRQGTGSSPEGRVIHVTESPHVGEIDRYCRPSERMEKWLTACPNSRTLAQYSTKGYVGGLYCRVRNGTGCDPAAMAVIPKLRISIMYISVLVVGPDVSLRLEFILY